MRRGIFSRSRGKKNSATVRGIDHVNSLFPFSPCVIYYSEWHVSLLEVARSEEVQGRGSRNILQRNFALLSSILWLEAIKWRNVFGGGAGDGLTRTLEKMGTGPSGRTTDLRCQKCFKVKTVSLFGGVGVGDVNSGRKERRR